MIAGLTITGNGGGVRLYQQTEGLLHGASIYDMRFEGIDAGGVGISNSMPNILEVRVAASHFIDKSGSGVNAHNTDLTVDG